MHIKKLVIASHNAGKVREIGALLEPLRIEVIAAAALDLPEPEEDGDSFHANATIKSRAAARASGLPALADDSGLAVAALDGAPGIYSARWAGPNKDFAMAMDRVRQELERKQGRAEGAAACFVCVLSLYWPDGREQCFEGRVHGTLTFPPRGDKGFGYDPVFVPQGESRTFAEMTAEEKQRISHRARAFAAMTEWLRQQEAA